MLSSIYFDIFTYLHATLPVLDVFIVIGIIETVQCFYNLFFKSILKCLKSG